MDGMEIKNALPDKMKSWVSLNFRRCFIFLENRRRRRFHDPFDNLNPVLLDFPESFHTERLTIRSPQWGDGAEVNAAIRESVEQLRPWLPFAENIPSLEESEVNVRNARLRFMERSDLMLHLRDRATDEFVGSSGLHRMDWKARSFEIGYWVRTTRSGEGLVTEAVRG